MGEKGLGWRAGHSTSVAARASRPPSAVSSATYSYSDSRIPCLWLVAYSQVPSAYGPAQLSARPAASLAHAMRCAALPVLLSRFLSLSFPTYSKPVP